MTILRNPCVVLTYDTVNRLLYSALYITNAHRIAAMLWYACMRFITERERCGSISRDFLGLRLYSKRKIACTVSLIVCEEKRKKI